MRKQSITGSINIRKEHDMRKKHSESDKKLSNIGTKSAKFFNALLEGKIVSRKTLGKMEISEYNDPAHSYASELINKKYIPIERQIMSNGICNYSMNPEEIKRFNNPELRKQQSDETRTQVEQKRRARFIKYAHSYLARLESNPDIWRFIPELPKELQLIITKMGAILRNKNGTN